MGREVDSFLRSLVSSRARLPKISPDTLSLRMLNILCLTREAGIAIREAKKDGYTKAVHGDGINLSYPNSTVSRGRVGKQCAQTLLTGGSMGVLLCCRIRRLTPKGVLAAAGI